MVNVQLEALLLRKHNVLRGVLRLTGVELDLVKFVDQLLLLFHFGLAHDLANGELERAQAADVGDVDMQQTVQSGPLTDVG